jgi:hypothetical protein
MLCACVCVCVWARACACLFNFMAFFAVYITEIFHILCVNNDVKYELFLCLEL